MSEMKPVMCGGYAIFIPSSDPCDSCDQLIEQVDAALRKMHMSATVTLTSGGWVNDTQTVAVTGVTGTNAVLVSPVPSDQEDYTSAGIYASAQAADSLTFTKTDSVSGDIDVNVLIINEGGLE